MFFKLKNSLNTVLLLIFFVSATAYLCSGFVLSQVGYFLIVDEKPYKKADAAVVLFTGKEYYPRLIQAADLYNHNDVKKIIINGNRKTATLKRLEKNGYTPPCVWSEKYLLILESIGVPRTDVICISAEDVYDTTTEANKILSEISKTNIQSIIITTSKSHTRRAKHIWTNSAQNTIKIQLSASKNDPYDPENWWHSGRQIRWVLSEYGAWVFYFWKQLTKNTWVDA